MFAKVDGYRAEVWNDESCAMYAGREEAFAFVL